MFEKIYRPAIVALLFPVLFGFLFQGKAMADVDAARKAILEELAGKAGQPFSAQRGAKLFAGRHKGGKPETPSCTSCHGKSPADTGRTRAGKEIAPMALSISKERYSDARKVSKWFRRNCRSVLGRDCTPLEKGDFITFMESR